MEQVFEKIIDLYLQVEKHKYDAHQSKQQLIRREKEIEKLKSIQPTDNTDEIKMKLKQTQEEVASQKTIIEQLKVRIHL